MYFQSFLYVMDLFTILNYKIGEFTTKLDNHVRSLAIRRALGHFYA